MTICLFQQIMKGLPRRKIDHLVATYGSDKWCKGFTTFNHLGVMIFAQLSGQTSLRDLEAAFNASAERHYHLGAKQVKRSTLSDANAARPAGVFEAILSLLLEDMASQAGKQIGALVRILDATTISLFAKTHKVMRYRSNNAAIKLHLMLDPDGQCPTWFQITPARLHDSRLCERLPLAAGHAYVFDRAYNKADFWADIEAAGAVFVTRPKSNLAYDVLASTPHYNSLIVADETIILAGQPGRKYTKPLRRIEIFDEDKGRVLAFISNDFERPAEGNRRALQTALADRTVLQVAQAEPQNQTLPGQKPKGHPVANHHGPDRLCASEKTAQGQPHRYSPKTHRRTDNQLSLQPERHKPTHQTTSKTNTAKNPKSARPKFSRTVMTSGGCL